MMKLEVRELLRAHVDTYEKLGLLLHLRGVSDTLGADALSEALNLSAHDARDSLLQLKAADLIAEPAPGEFRYQPRTAALGASVDALAELYADSPVRVVRWMNRNAIDRMHSSAAGALAGAILRTKKPSGG